MLNPYKIKNNWIRRFVIILEAPIEIIGCGLIAMIMGMKSGLSNACGAWTLRD